MITVGFTLIGRGAWSGGETYQRNMLGVIASELSGQVSAKLFLTPEQHRKVGATFDRFLGEPAIVDDSIAGAGEGRRAIVALATGRDETFGVIVKAHGVDVMFESAQWFGNRFPVPVLSWIPDFQHRRLPTLFSRKAWWKRELGFRVQTAGRRVVMLSSQDARADCERFYPAARDKTAVVRFAIDLDPALVLADSNEVRQIYGLPRRYFYLPNQFWSHKQHAVVVEALILIKRHYGTDHTPTVVLTGRTDNPHDPGLYQRLMGRIADNDLQGNFRHLGLIPYEDVFRLSAAADHVLNPSSFEGWSTTVEEAKALGTPLVLSDIALHREQAPDARFFPLGNAEALASVLMAIADDELVPRKAVKALVDAQAERRRGYGQALLGALQQTSNGI